MDARQTVCQKGNARNLEALRWRKIVIFVGRKKSFRKTSAFQIVDCIKSLRVANVPAKMDILDLDINVNRGVESIKNGRIKNVFAYQNMLK